jgi:Rod binding domain-containing protein
VPDSFSSLTLSSPSDVSWAAESSALAAGKSTATVGRNRNRIDNAAQEFEATLLTKWLEDARHSCGQAPGGDEDEDGDGDGDHRSEMLDLGLKSLASAITKSGGIGIARVLRHELQVRNSAGSVPDGQSKFTVGTLARPPKINLKKD